MVKSFRAALTQNLLQQPMSSSKTFDNITPSQADFSLAFAKHSQPCEANLDTLLSKKLGSCLEEIKSEPKKTRETIDDLRKEMHEHIEKSNNKINAVERRIEAVEKKVRTTESALSDYMSMINRIVETICLVIIHTVNVSIDEKNDFVLVTQNLKAHSNRPELTK